MTNDYQHRHHSDDIEEHSHPHDNDAPSSNDVWDDSALVLTTVGVDIGSSTTHFAISRLRLTMQGTRYAPSGAYLVYQSSILLTPYISGETIDVASLKRFFEAQYEAANIDREEIDTGVVLLTGVAAERSNARLAAEIFADSTGRFVSMSAGHHLEAELGVRGSGALALSREMDLNVLHIDIGGGTTKFTLCGRGKVLSTAALAVGARLVVRDNRGIILRLEWAGKLILDELGVQTKVGGHISKEVVEDLCRNFADRIMEVVKGRELSVTARRLLLTDELARGEIDAITFSGGVSEYIYGRSQEEFGDLGDVLGKAVRSQILESDISLLEPPTGGIRATVMGASRFAVRVSSQTVYIDPPETVPVRNIRAIVVEPFAISESPMVEQVVSGIVSSLSSRDINAQEERIAFALRWSGLATFSRLDVVCRGLVEAMRPSLESGAPLIIVVNQDFGRLIGMHLRQEELFTGPMICIDGIELNDFDYIDVPKVPESPGAIPIVVKTLVFPD